MLVVNVLWIIRLRGSKHPYSYLIAHGYSEQEARTLLSTKSKRVDLDKLIRLSRTFKCRIHDLFDWQGDPDDPLAYLKKPDLPELERLLEDKSPEEILNMLRGLNGDDDGE